MAETLNKELDEQEAMYKNVRQSEIDHLKRSIEGEKAAQVQGSMNNLLIQNPKKSKSRKKILTFLNQKYLLKLKEGPYGCHEPS